MKSRSNRICGGCTACCQTHPVKELGKPAQHPCLHCNSWGCGIYSTRPRGCREFVCEWIKGVGKDDCRPDRTGVVLDFQESPMLRRVVMTMWEYQPDSLKSDRIKDQTKDILAAAIIVIWIDYHGNKSLFTPPHETLSRKVRRELFRQGIKIVKTKML